MKKLLYYLISCYPAILIITGNLLGGWWTITGIINFLGFMIVIEWIFSKEDKTENHFKSKAPDYILYLQVLLHTASIASLVFGCYVGILQGKFIYFASVSTGMYGGQAGIVVAHELIHRRQQYLRFMGIWNLVLVNYGHFYVEHIRSHHKYVGTPRDPATARYGENIYSFILRTIPAQFISAFNIESERLKKIYGNAFFMRNYVVMISILQLLIVALVGYFFGIKAMLAYLNCGIVSVILLEYVNYIEHYGLVRKEGEKVNSGHSWQTDLSLSRITLIELSRHSDHHNYASKPFYKLSSIPESPVLPGGYFSVFYLVIIPPLWFKKIHPLLSNYRKQIDL